MSENLNRAGIHAVLGAGGLILNDYALDVTPIERGYRLTVTRGSETQTMDVLDGVGIVGIEKTGSTGDVDSYRIRFTDGSTFDYTVETNAAAHAAAEAARVEAENSRVSAEAERVSAESGRVNAEDARVAGEAGRESAETARASAESERAQAEDGRQNAEAARVAAEQSRASAESVRVAAENARVAAETARANAENERAGAETLRAAAETDRANAESGRVSAEQGRVSAESERVAAEEARATEFAGFSGEITQLKDYLTDFKDGFSRLNLFKEAELYAENSYVNIKDGKLNPSSNSAYDIYIIAVDGISKYTANKLVTFSLPLAEDKITATNPSILSRLTQFDTSLYDGTKYLALSVIKTEAPTFAISKGDIATDSVDFPGWYKKDTDFIKQKINSSCVTFEVETDTMSSGDSLIACERLDISKNTVEEFFANVVSFDSLTIGHGGATRFMGSEIVINNTNVLIKSYKDRVLKNVEHNLTISDFIFVLLEKDDKTRCKVTLITNGGTFVTETNSTGGFYAVNGNIFAATTSELSNATLKFMAKDINADTWVFGDSYITLNDVNKYMTQLVNMGFANKLLTCGYGGANSAMIIKSFENLVAIHIPKRIVWAAGMNDKDLSDGVNLTWKAKYYSVRDYCNNNNIELILATIPNTPSDTTANTFKNQIVRESGYRYIDFAKAVDAESDNATWYDGMLSSDNVHPAELGAKVLAARFLIDLPEII